MRRKAIEKKEKGRGPGVRRGQPGVKRKRKSQNKIERSVERCERVQFIHKRIKRHREGMEPKGRAKR